MAAKVRTPPHPGDVIRNLVEDADVTVTEFAKRVGVSRALVSDIIHGHGRISVVMALYLERANLGSAESWLQLQMDYELWRARSVNKKRHAVGAHNRLR